MVTDCFLTALAQTIGPNDLIRGYADDIGMVLRNVWRDGPLISNMFQCIARISCLHLNGKKCIFIPLWQFSADGVSELLWSRIPAWSALLIKSYGKYLGFLIGPGAQNKEWDSIMPKVLETARFIKSLGLPKFHAFLLYQMLGTSQLLFVAQLRRPPRGLRRIELGAARAIIGGPGLWAPMRFFHHIQSQCKFPVAFPAFDTLCRATMIRTGLCTSPGWRANLRTLEANALELESNLVHPFAKWMEGCAVFMLREACSGFNLQEFRAAATGGIGIDVLEDCHLQRRVYQYLLPRTHPFDLHEGLSCKLSRWFPSEEASLRAARACHVVNSIHKHVPPCVLFCLLNTWCNGWCTNRRFQIRSGRCSLCLGCTGDDSLEHYAVCPFQWDVFARKLRQPMFPLSFSRFLVLEAASVEEMVFHACHVYAVRRAVNSRHRESANMGEEYVRDLLWNGHKTAAIQHMGLSRRYALIFA